MAPLTPRQASRRGERRGLSCGEIAAYTGLIEMALAIGETDAVSLLEENLKEEKELFAKWNR
jgi:ferritin-like metal-binding protein YciE